MARLVLVAALVLAACAGPPVSGPGATGAAASGPGANAPLRVQSFNLRLNLESDGDDAWPFRREAAVAILAEADVVGVQEALPDMLADIDAALPAYARLGVGRQADGGGEFSAIYYRTARLAPLADGTFWLSETPAVPGSQSWDAALPRIATWARVRDRATGDTLLVVNTHFDHVGAEARRQSARLILDRLDRLAQGHPVVLLGDFNVTDDSDVYRLLADRLGDARLVSEATPTGVPATWNGFGRDPLERRIDFVFVRGPLRVLSFATRDETIGQVLGTDSARYPSDHFPVEAVVRLGDG
ncbi:MAG: endonuclease/exonuclease/phosphatase family protein [Bacteroidota bacterium]